MGERHMSSIFPECDQLKQIYDKCFTEFFQRFISPNYRHSYASNPCDRLLEVYQHCVEERLEKNKPFEIDLEEIRKEYLNSPEDDLKDRQQ
ncbi:unnamed protein product [Caenorhabditis auriculariae]|uniref:Uncharacterized protein n=1 Tax=Caenorhabditis auriculariae TaxID=2777116 RepID=A0A8S1H9K6_9PELO|nr:unnamed protein product [Caenorhabditis auriculariae]